MAYLARNIWVRKWLKRRPSIKGAMSRFEDLGLLGFWSICERLSPERASRFGAAVLAALGPRSSKQEKLIDNLRVAFPDWSDVERERVALGIWRSMGACAGEYPHLGAFGVRADTASARRPASLKRAAMNSACAMSTQKPSAFIAIGSATLWCTSCSTRFTMR